MSAYRILNIPIFATHKFIKDEIEKSIKITKGDYKLNFKPGSSHCTLILKTEMDFPSKINLKNKSYDVIPFTEKPNKNRTLERVESFSVADMSNYDIRDSVTPLWKMKYEDQVKLKKRKIEKFFKMNIEYISTSHFFRNNCQFAFGKDFNNIPCIGFKGNAFKNNYNLVFDIENCLNVSMTMKEKINAVKRIIVGYGDCIYDRNTYTGYLRQLMIRENCNQSICLVQIQDSEELFRNFFVNNFLKEKKDLKSEDGKYYRKNIEKDINYIQNEIVDNDSKQETFMCDLKYENSTNNNNISTNDGLTLEYKQSRDSILENKNDNSSISSFDNENAREVKSNCIFNQTLKLIMEFPFENLYIIFNKAKHDGFVPSQIFKIRGKDHFYQNFMGYSFRVSFFSFFQNNTEISELICNKISKISSKSEILYDLCCGIGMFAISLNKTYKKIIGVEMNKECVKDALNNLKINKITNIEIKEGNVENEIFNEEAVIILDPPRSGVSKKTICNIRKNKNIDEIFFISCDYINSNQNIVDLCRETSKKYENEKFQIVSVTGFDMFPNTKKSEVLIHLKRKKNIN